MHEAKTPEGTQKNNKENKQKVLIAEDNRINMLLTRNIISKAFPEIEIFQVVNGKEAVEQTKKSLPNIILMDIHMPEMNGYEATKEIRKFNQEVKIIAFTGGTLNDEEAKSVEAGMNDFIKKPIVQEAIEATILKWLITHQDTLNEHFDLEELKAKLDHDQAVVEMLLEEMLSDLNKAIPKIQGFQAEKQYVKLKTYFHILTGSASTASLNKLVSLVSVGKNMESVDNAFIEEVITEIKACKKAIEQTLATKS